MTLFRRTLIPIAIIIGIASCKKSQNNPAQPSSLDYMHLKAGNYWVYEEFNVDNNGAATPTGAIDSFYVANDTLINGHIYHTLVELSVSLDNQVVYLADSAGYIVNSDRTIMFSANDFIDTFKEKVLTVDDTLGNPEAIGIATLQMINKNVSTSVPAGIFTTSTFARQYIITKSPWDQYGAIRGFYYKYSPDIGLVSETVTCNLALPYATEARLIRYSVK